MFGGKLQLRVRSRQWPVRVGRPELLRRDGAQVAYLLGRGSTAYLQSNAPGLADEHCWISWDGLQVKVVPCNGQAVRINGVETREERTLLPGDVLQAGELVLRLVKTDVGVATSGTVNPQHQTSQQADDLTRIAGDVLLGGSGDSMAPQTDMDPRGSRIMERLSQVKPAPSPKGAASSTQSPRSDTGKAADEALSRLFRRRLAEQKRVEAKPPRRPDAT
ncbi:MAG: hypothetical protein KatS3mg110_2099 [Pirellulaceae bacterium]|nr:MAG: hypothetical protein KatS3mg110_2099 [Pirellulaceae bacterium]